MVSWDGGGRRGSGKPGHLWTCSPTCHMERDKFHNLSITHKFFSQIGLAEYLAFNVMRKKQREASTNMLGIVELGKTIFAGSYS